MSYLRPAEGDVFCINCQRWIRGPNKIHTCFDRGLLRDEWGERVKCLIIAFSRTGRKTHLAWAKGLDLTAMRALCGIGPVGLTVDRATWPYKRGGPGLCKQCVHGWVREAYYVDFV